MKIRVIFGCNEELGSSCVKYYFTKKPYPKMGFTPDASFPVVYGEKAGCGFNIEGHVEKGGLIYLCAGNRPNIVPVSSATPRPYNLSSLIITLKGSLSHPTSFTGTTSRCPRIPNVSSPSPISI